MTGLMICQNCEEQVHLVVGSSALSLQRIARSLEYGARVILVAPNDDSSSENWQTDVRETTAQSNRLTWIERDFSMKDLTTLGRQEVCNVVDMVFVALPRTSPLREAISDECKKLRIPINVTDSLALSSFTVPSTHKVGPLQIGVTTSGNGCRLANRIRRHVVSSLPENIAKGCTNIGELRRLIETEDAKVLQDRIVAASSYHEIGQHEDDAIQTHRLNELVLEENIEKDLELKRKQRMRWLLQLVEYYPLSQLATLSLDDLSRSYNRESAGHNNLNDTTGNEIIPDYSISKGKLYLVGSGPGATGLLTTAALKAITAADLVLADKLVPSEVLDLVPRHVETFIARKFPGNAEAAQQELLDLGLSALNSGKFVVRLKQGDPYIFGRGAEEYIFFSKHGYKPIVIPGITSALAGPVLAAISPTHREVSDQVLICTGTGRKGAIPNIPDYVKSRTTIFLMALHRLRDLLKWLEDAGWSKAVPCAIVERASCPDQRVIRSTLEYIAEAFESAGSRPPGILVTGDSCDVIEQLEEGSKWSIEENNGSFS
ncbi:tetrapyrrole methylase [Dipodascopsis uninucleata]